MLSSKMTADEEAEVQAEMEALEREANGIVEAEVPPAKQGVSLPDVPTVEPAQPERQQQQQQQQSTEASQPERQALLA